MKLMLITILLTSCASRYGMKEIKSGYDSRSITIMCTHIDNIGENERIGKELFNSYENCRSSDKFIKRTNKLKAKVRLEAIKEDELREQKRIIRIRKYINKNRDYKSFQAKAEKGAISIGMPEELVYMSIGRPIKTNKTVMTWGMRKQLIYKKLYVYVESGKVTSWQSF